MRDKNVIREARESILAETYCCYDDAISSIQVYTSPLYISNPNVGIEKTLLLFFFLRTKNEEEDGG